MGMERWYVAVPENSSLLERAKAEPEFGEYLGSPSIFEVGGVGWNPWYTEAAEFCTAVAQMNIIHPGIYQRVYTLERYYDILHYLLSDAYRRGQFDATDWATHAIRGACALPEHLRGGQGHPIRYTPAAQVQEIAGRLAGLEHASLRLSYDPTDMVRQGVYKFHPQDDNPQDWAWVCEFFDGFQAFYQEVARYDEAVLAIVT